jgi:hypothetical protein
VRGPGRAEHARSGRRFNVLRLPWPPAVRKSKSLNLSERTLYYTHPLHDPATVNEQRTGLTARQLLAQQVWVMAGWRGRPGLGGVTRRILASGPLDFMYPTV